MNSTHSNERDEEVLTINHDEIRIAIRRLKNNKASISLPDTDDLPEKLFRVCVKYSFWKACLTLDTKVKIVQYSRTGDLTRCKTIGDQLDFNSI